MHDLRFELKALALALAFLSMVVGPAHAEDGPVIGWDDLAVSVEPYDDPFLDMTPEQKSDLRDVLVAREAAAAGYDDTRLAENAAAAMTR